MKVGDAVRWIGFPGATHPKQGGPSVAGIIIEAYLITGQLRLTVAWGDGSIGNRLYPGTVEVISEGR
tara:strand:+ start:485 stop:685 length:201 start_codon:yes stop_codon:yes gene_type:complete